MTTDDDLDRVPEGFPPTKRCCRCHREHPRTHRYFCRVTPKPSTSRADGLCETCKRCRNLAQAMWRRTAAGKTYYRAWRRTPEYRARVNANARRQRAGGARAASNRRWNERNLLHKKALTAVCLALRYRRLVRPATCHDCGRTERVYACVVEDARPFDGLAFRCYDCRAAWRQRLDVERRQRTRARVRTEEWRRIHEAHVATLAREAAEVERVRTERGDRYAFLWEIYLDWPVGERRRKVEAILAAETSAAAGHAGSPLPTMSTARSSRRSR